MLPSIGAGPGPWHVPAQVLGTCSRGSKSQIMASNTGGGGRSDLTPPRGCRAKPVGLIFYPHELGRFVLPRRMKRNHKHAPRTAREATPT